MFLVETLQEPAQALARITSVVLNGELQDVQTESVLHREVDNLFVGMFQLAKDAGLLAYEYGRNASDTRSGTTGKCSSSQMPMSACVAVLRLLVG